MIYYTAIMVTVVLLLIIAVPLAILLGSVTAISHIAKRLFRKKTTIEAKEEYEPAKNGKNSFRRHVNMGNIAVDVWFYPDKNLIKRVVRIRDKVLAEKYGRKLNLDSIEDADFNEADSIVEQTVREVKNKFRIKTTKAVVNLPRTNIAYTGEVIRFGMETREGKDGKYDTFVLHLLDDQVDAPHELRGSDLQRAIKEAEVQIGDAVKVESLGRTPVQLGNSKTGFKNLWAITKI